MKHVVILAHPSERSFAASVAKTYTDAAIALGHTVVARDLYRLGFDPCLKLNELPFGPEFAPGADVIAERRMIHDADAFVLVYPLWLNSQPAILKGYLDRVFGFGFAYGENGRSTPLLHGKKLITFTSSGAPLSWVQDTGALEAIKTLFDRYFAELCGMDFLEHLHFGGIVPGIREDAAQSCFSKVAAVVHKHFQTNANPASGRASAPPSS